MPFLTFAFVFLSHSHGKTSPLWSSLPRGCWHDAHECIQTCLNPSDDGASMSEAPSSDVPQGSRLLAHTCWRQTWTVSMEGRMESLPPFFIPPSLPPSIFFSVLAFYISLWSLCCWWKCCLLPPWFLHQQRATHVHSKATVLPTVRCLLLCLESTIFSNYLICVIKCLQSIRLP